MMTGALGAIGAAADVRTSEGAPDAGAAMAELTQSPEAMSAQALHDISEHMADLRRLFREAHIGPSVVHGILVEVRRQFGIFLKANQKYPDFCEVGPAVFTDVYDWHVRYQQAIEVSRVDNRTAIRFMFTWLILRPDQDDLYVGIPFDRA
jgi:hypothetical protein